MEKLESAIKKLKDDKYIKKDNYNDYLLDLGYDLNFKIKKLKA